MTDPGSPRRRTAIVTGGARGIGRAACLRLAQDGCAVVVADLQQSGAGVAEEIAAAGGEACFVVADVADRAAVDALVEEALARFGGADVLVAAAGIVGEDHPVAELPLEEYRRVLEVDLTGVLHCCQAVLPHMLSGGWGRIVAITSNARHGAPDRAHYAIAKAGVVALMQSIAFGYARAGVLANSIDPGMVLTEMVRDRYPAEHLANPPGIAIGRLADPAEIAETIAFLCSERNTYTVGTIVESTGRLVVG
jgi:2-hydroxycyclohexanecarboxyl-CoA dehydrogenase